MEYVLTLDRTIWVEFNLLLQRWPASLDEAKCMNTPTQIIYFFDRDLPNDVREFVQELHVLDKKYILHACADSPPDLPVVNLDKDM